MAENENTGTTESTSSGSGERYRPWLRLACGSPILAQAVVHGELEGAFVNPSGFVTQAYRGTGLFSATPRASASSTSWLPVTSWPEP